MTRVLVLTVAVLFMPVAIAGDKERFYAAHDETCGQYLLDRRSTAATLSHVAWVSGYVTAYNRQTPNTYDIMSGRGSSEVIPWLDQWCKLNPSKTLSKAMEALTMDLFSKRQQTRLETSQPKKP